MNTIHDGYRSLSFLFFLNWDRLLYVFTIFFALILGGFFGSL